MGWEKLRKHLVESRDSLVTFRETLKEVKVTLIDVAGIVSLILLFYRIYFGG